VRRDESRLYRMLTPAINRGMFYVEAGCEHGV
jgi:hypothetical protein